MFKFFNSTVRLIAFLFRGKRLEAKTHVWAIYFDGEWVGSYVGEDLSGLRIECWMKDLPGAPEPIMVADYFETY